MLTVFSAHIFQQFRWVVITEERGSVFFFKKIAQYKERGSVGGWSPRNGNMGPHLPCTPGPIMLYQGFNLESQYQRDNIEVICNGFPIKNI
jgi:hypothetical protein